MGSSTVPCVVLLGTSAFPFFADAADVIVAPCPTPPRGEVAGADHGWQPEDLADAIAAHLRWLSIRGRPVRVGV